MYPLWLNYYYYFGNVQGHFNNSPDRKCRERSSYPIFCSSVDGPRFEEPILWLHIHNTIWDDAKDV